MTARLKVEMKAAKKVELSAAWMASLSAELMVASSETRLVVMRVVTWVEWKVGEKALTTVVLKALWMAEAKVVESGAPLVARMAAVLGGWTVACSGDWMAGWWADATE